MSFNETDVTKRGIVCGKVHVLVSALAKVQGAAHSTENPPKHDCEARCYVYFCEVKHQKKRRQHDVNNEEEERAYETRKATHPWFFCRFQQARLRTCTTAA